jgi:hypothetical protein
VLVLHDVIRHYARGRLGYVGQAAAHAALVGAARHLAGPDAAAGIGMAEDWGGGTAWWRLPETAGCDYLWQYLTYDLQAAGLDAELDQVGGDLRFLADRLCRYGPTAVDAELARSSSPTAGRLRRAVEHYTHLLGPIEPPGALTTMLTSRLGGVPEVVGQLPGLRSGLGAWTAWPCWPPPDQPSDALNHARRGIGPAAWGSAGRRTRRLCPGRGGNPSVRTAGRGRSALSAISPRGFSRRTRRALLRAPGAPRVLAAG